jgi:hypothetical protein
VHLTICSALLSNAACSLHAATKVLMTSSRWILDARVVTVVLLLRAQPTNLVQLSCIHCAAACRLLPWRRLSHLSASGSQLHLLNLAKSSNSYILEWAYQELLPNRLTSLGWKSSLRPSFSQVHAQLLPGRTGCLFVSLGSGFELPSVHAGECFTRTWHAYWWLYMGVGCLCMFFSARVLLLVLHGCILF